MANCEGLFYHRGNIPLPKAFALVREALRRSESGYSVNTVSTFGGIDSLTEVLYRIRPAFIVHSVEGFGPSRI